MAKISDMILIVTYFLTSQKNLEKKKKYKKIQKDTNEESPEDCPSWW
jgi:hypothetical protein